MNQGLRPMTAQLIIVPKQKSDPFYIYPCKVVHVTIENTSGR